jgi:hypothetical protein
MTCKLTIQAGKTFKFSTGAKVNCSSVERDTSIDYNSLPLAARQEPNRALICLLPFVLKSLSQEADNEVPAAIS